MSLITLLDSHLAYGDRPLLDGAQLAVRSGEKVGLIGRNGTGKSTLLRVIAGLTQLDEGEVQRRDGLRITFVEQEPELPPSSTLRESLLARAQAVQTYRRFLGVSDGFERDLNAPPSMRRKRK